MNPELPVVDCEHHVVAESLEDLAPHLPPGWLERLRRGEFRMPRPGPHPGVQLEGRRLERGSDPAEAARRLDDAISAAILIPSQVLVSSGWLGHVMAAVFASAMNDHVIERWLPADARFRFAIAVASHDGEVAAREIHRLGEHPGAVAVCLSPVAVNLGRRHYHPIYAAAQEHGLAVIVHPGGFEGNVVGPAVLGGVGPRTPEETFSLLPQVAMSNLASLLYDGVFEQFPELRVVFAGFGFSWVPPLLWRMDTEWRGLRVEVPWLTRAPSEYAAEHVRFVVDGAAELGAGAWTVAAMAPPSALLWGSDEPFLDADPARVFDAAPSELREGLAFANAESAFPSLRKVVA
jgi:predicted TIM-barrel fold metal-dependent hydrolase